MVSPVVLSKKDSELTYNSLRVIYLEVVGVRPPNISTFTQQYNNDIQERKLSREEVRNLYRSFLIKDIITTERRRKKEAQANNEKYDMKYVLADGERISFNKPNDKFREGKTTGRPINDRKERKAVCEPVYNTKDNPTRVTSQVAEQNWVCGSRPEPNPLVGVPGEAKGEREEKEDDAVRTLDELTQGLKNPVENFYRPVAKRIGGRQLNNMLRDWLDVNAKNLEPRRMRPQAKKEPTPWGELKTNIVQYMNEEAFSKFFRDMGWTRFIGTAEGYSLSEGGSIIWKPAVMKKEDLLEPKMGCGKSGRMMTKGSLEAKEHMAKLRAMRKKK